MAEKEENKQVNLFESSLETDFSKPKTLDTSGLEKQIQKIQTPASSNVYDKLAALYRQETQGRSLRETTDLQRALLPAAELYRQREEEANERFAELVEQIPTFDDSTLYGEKTGGVGFENEIMGISNEIRSDLRLLSRLNPADPRYNELAQKVRQKQNNIIKYNDLNQKLLDIRNSEIDPSEISNVYSQAEKQAYRDILLGKSENISFKNGTLTYTYKNPDDESAEPIIVDLEKLDINPFEVSDDVRSTELEIRSAAEEFKGEILDANGNPTLEYSKKIGMLLRSFKRTPGKQIKGLILDGNVLPGSNQYINVNTQAFIKLLNDNGFTFEELQKSEMLGEKVTINGVEKTVKQHFFDYYEDYINQTATKAGSSKKSTRFNPFNIQDSLELEPSGRPKRFATIRPELSNAGFKGNVLVKSTSFGFIKLTESGKVNFEFNDDYSFTDGDGNKRVFEKGKEISVTPEQLETIINTLESAYPLKNISSNQISDDIGIIDVFDPSISTPKNYEKLIRRRIPSLNPFRSMYPRNLISK